MKQIVSKLYDNYYVIKRASDYYLLHHQLCFIIVYVCHIIWFTVVKFGAEPVDIF